MLTGQTGLKQTKFWIFLVNVCRDQPLIQLYRKASNVLASQEHIGLPSELLLGWKGSYAGCHDGCAQIMPDCRERQVFHLITIKIPFGVGITDHTYLVNAEHFSFSTRYSDQCCLFLCNGFDVFVCFQTLTQPATTYGCARVETNIEPCLDATDFRIDRFNEKHAGGRGLDVVDIVIIWR